MRTIDNKEQITITLSGFDLKLILEALERDYFVIDHSHGLGLHP